MTKTRWIIVIAAIGIWVILLVGFIGYFVGVTTMEYGKKGDLEPCFSDDGRWYVMLYQNQNYHQVSLCMYENSCLADDGTYIREYDAKTMPYTVLAVRGNRYAREFGWMPESYDFWWWDSDTGIHYFYYIDGAWQCYVVEDISGNTLTIRPGEWEGMEPSKSLTLTFSSIPEKLQEKYAYYRSFDAQ